MPAPTVELIYRPGPPADYAARLRDGGWLEAWGWTEDDAVAALAATVLELDPSLVPARHRASVESVASWLTPHCATPVLDA